MSPQAGFTAGNLKMDARITRRSVLGSIGAAGMFPVLAQAIAPGAPRVERPLLQAGLRIGEPQAGEAGWRHATILGGSMIGGLLQGEVQSGRIEWLVDPASGAVEVAASMQVLRSDGARIELRDRSSAAGADHQHGMPGVPTAPRLFDAAGVPLPQPMLAGRLDASLLAQGAVTLRAFARR